MTRRKDKWKECLNEIWDLYEHASATFFYCDYGSKQEQEEMHRMDAIKLCAKIVENHMPKEPQKKKVKRNE